MCGISLIINSQNERVTADQISRMNNKVAHRGPDDEGYFFGEGFALGHRRLSIIDTSSAGHQPMQKDNDWIVYNGMLYNYPDLRDKLVAAGHTFKSNTDTEVILAAYQQWGVHAFERFNGMWAFAIYDAVKQQIILCRDHFGIKPLYYTKAGNLFLAGSEIKQFLVFPECSRVLNTVVTLNFLTRGWLNYSDETFFKNISSLQAGYYLTYDLSSHERQLQQWYSFQQAVVFEDATLQEATEKTRSLFESSVQMRMRSDVPVGSCLSGGVDSSSIISMIYKNGLANNQFTTFSSCYSNKAYDEQVYSDLVTEQTGFASVKVYPSLDDLLEKADLDTLIYHSDQPFSSASHYSEFAIFKAASQQNLKVMLGGQGADEYLCGYPEFFPLFLKELLLTGQYKKALQNIIAKGKHGKGTAGVLKETVAAWFVHPLIGLLKKLFGKSPFPWLQPVYNQLAKDGPLNSTHKNVKQLSIQQITCSSLPYQLHSEDRNAMSFSIEARLPFLDHRLTAYVTGLPAACKIDNGYSKYVLRQAIPGLPDKIRWRKEKLGFAAPDKEWILTQQQTIRKELELAIRETNFFSPDLLTRFDRFVQGKLGYEPIYFRAMTLRRFCKIFNMQQAEDQDRKQKPFAALTA